MTVDARAISWHLLMPPGSSYTVRSGPASFREAVASLSGSGGERVLVSWDEHAQDLPNLDGYAGLVAMNCRGITARHLRDAGFAYVRRFAVLPALDDPRWFIPLGTPRVTEGALRINTPFRAAGRAKHLGARVAARLGVDVLFRHQFILAQRQVPPLERALRLALATPTLEIAMSTGTPGPARKPTLAALDQTGRWLAFAKLSCSAQSRQLVAREADCLRRLAAHPTIASHVPQLLFETTFDDTHVVAQRSLPGTMPGTALTPGHRRLLDALGQGPGRPARATRFMATLAARSRVASIPGIAAARLLELVERALDGVVVPQTATHGDFTPWNLRRAGDTLRVFDWEYGELDGLPLLDEVQYVLQGGLLLHDWTEDEAFAALMRFRSVQADRTYAPRVVRALQVASLLDALLRSDAEGHRHDTPAETVRRNLLRRLAHHLREDLDA